MNNKEKFDVHISKIDLSSIGECEIIVRSCEDHMKPRFYIVGADGKDICAICMFKPKFVYGKLNNEQLKELEDKLNSDGRFTTSITKRRLCVREELFIGWSGVHDTIREHKYVELEKVDFSKTV